MYVNELGTREINEYYARKRSINRTSNISSFAERLQKVTENRKASEAADVDSTSSTESKDACCEKCALNSQLASLSSQLVKQMMTQGLYTQTGFGLTSGGTGALAAYQSMAKLFGGSLFS